MAVTTESPGLVAGAAVGTRDKTVGWYTPQLDTLDDGIRELLEKYSHIEPGRVIPYVLEAVCHSFPSPMPCVFWTLTSAKRDRAWEVHPYPCIGQIRFIDLSLSRNPSYSTVLSRLHSGASLLDLGCCFAQDLRKLVFDGAPSTNLYGAELEGEFIDMAYDFFGDRETLGAKFMVADVFDPESPLKQLDGKLDFVHVGLFLHLFDWERQVKACERIVKLLKNERGVLVLGQQMATTEPGAVLSGAKVLFKHNVESFEKLWAEVGEKTSTKWKVTGSLDMGLGIKEGKRRWDDEKARRLVFEVERIE
jgi:SAM-dependent methyltransferase